CREHRRVRLVDLAGTERLARPAQLRPGAEHRDPWASRAGDPIEAGSRERPDVRGRQRRSRHDNHVARTNVAALRTNVCTMDNSIADLDLVVMLDNVLDG